MKRRASRDHRSKAIDGAAAGEITGTLNKIKTRIQFPDEIIHRLHTVFMVSVYGYHPLIPLP